VSHSLSYDIVRFKIKVGVEEKFMWKKCIETNATRHCDSTDNAAAVQAAMLAAAQSIPAGCHETKSPVWKSPLGELCDEKGRCFYPPRNDTLFSNYFEEDLLYMERIAILLYKVSFLLVSS